MKAILIIAFLLILCPVAALSQCPVMPAGFQCVAQATVNQAAENKRELDATKAALAVRDAALLEKDKIIQDNKVAADKNVADLKDALQRTQTDLATSTGQLIGANAQIVNQTAIIQFLLTNGRVKQNGLFNIKF